MLRCLLLNLLFLLAAAAWAGDLPPPVAEALRASGLPPSALALVARPLEAMPERRDGVPMGLTFNARQPMNPASTMKLLTTLAALERLGPDYRWHTEALIDGRLEEGVLYGDLILRGGGDPFLTWDRLGLWLRQLRGRGLRAVRGDLVLDRSAFAPIEHDPAAFDGQAQRPYNVGADALLINFNTLSLTLMPQAGQVLILGEPPLAGLDLDNRLRLADGPCGDWREALRAEFTRRGDAWRLDLSGPYPAGCGEKSWHLAGLPADDFVAAVFGALWRELGGEWSGQVRRGMAPPGARPLASFASPPLADLVREINKYSNNVMARHLLLTLGREHCRCAARPADGEAALRVWLRAAALALPGLVIENGAGLSRRERLSAEEMAALLHYAWRSPRMPEFIASLPIAGRDGTLRHRLRDEGFGGRAHLKTGLLDDTRALAGYLLDGQGRRWLVVFMVNHPQAAKALPIVDALLRWLWQGAARPLVPSSITRG